MKKIMIAAAAALVLAACETSMEDSSPVPSESSANPVIAPAPRAADMPVEARAGEARAQACVEKGFAPGTAKFSLCMGRDAEKTVASTPEPRRKPARKSRRTASGN